MNSSRAWLAASGLVLVLTACGSSDPTEGGGGSASSTTTEATSTATSSSTSTATSSASASASSSSGMVQCDGSGNCNQLGQGCVQCSYTGPCKFEYDACFGPGADADCKAFSDCADACHGDEPCIVMCENDHATGYPVWHALAKCAFCVACKEDCMLPPDASLCM